MWLTLSVLAALSFGTRGILYHWTSQKPINRNLLLFGAFTMGFIINLFCALLLSSNWTMAALIGMMMGLLSFGANGAMFKGFAVGKASLIAILTALPSVIVVVIAYFLWGEKLNSAQLAAFIIIVAGILLVRYSNDLSLKNLKGAQWGLIALMLFAFNDLSGKWSTLAEAELFPTMVFMFGTGASCFLIWWLRDLRQERHQRQEVLGEALAIIHGQNGAGTGTGLGAGTGVNAGTGAEATQNVPHAASLEATGSWSNKKTFLVGMGVGITNAVGMMFIVSAFDIGVTGLVSAVTSLNVLIVLLYTRFVVKEKFTRTEVAGIVLALIGIILMRLFQS